MDNTFEKGRVFRISKVIQREPLFSIRMAIILITFQENILHLNKHGDFAAGLATYHEKFLISFFSLIFIFLPINIQV